MTEEEFKFKIGENKMKIKRAAKKLVINKKTIANLDKREMENVEGGITQSPCNTVITCGRICCHTAECPRDPYTDYCWTVQFCTE